MIYFILIIIILFLISYNQFLREQIKILENKNNPKGNNKPENYGFTIEMFDVNGNKIVSQKLPKDHPYTSGK